MKILVTNDDGLHAPGIKALARAFHRQACEVWMVAPDRERSATGHAITIHHPLRAEEVTIPGTCHKAMMVDGTPADCVKLGVECIMSPKPDLVVSGINRGSNMGTDVLYSGTVSAALEAIMLGIPAIAVSLAGWDDLDYSVAAAFTRHLAERAYANHLPPDTLLNINVPPCSGEEIAGVRITKLGERRYRSFFEQRVDPRGKHYYWLAGEPVPGDDNLDTDVGAVDQRYISVTPMHIDLTRHAMIEGIKDWNLSFNWSQFAAEE